MHKNYFLLLKKFKNTESGQLWSFLNLPSFYCVKNISSIQRMSREPAAAAAEGGGGGGEPAGPASEGGVEAEPQVAVPDQAGPRGGHLHPGVQRQLRRVPEARGHRPPLQGHGHAGQRHAGHRGGSSCHCVANKK